MDRPPRIATARPIYKSQDYAFLRAEGLKILQEIAGDSWTDHNIHDPGITLLEAMCYSMTEIGMVAGMDMKDLLASGEPFASPEFFTVAQSLPVSPVSALDFQKILLDHPLVRNGWVSPLKDSPEGQLSVLLEFADDSLNTNIFSLPVSPLALGADYQIDLAFPYWDEADVRPFQEEVEILSATFINSWQPLKTDNSRFASIRLDYQPAAGPVASLELWLVLQVTSTLNNAVVEMPAILLEVESLLLTTPNENVFRAYNSRIIAATSSMRSVQRYIRDYRNLGEDFTEFKAVRLQEIAFSAILEVAAGVDIETLLGNIFFAIDQHLSPSIRMKSLHDLQSEGLDSAAIYEGPLLEKGFLEAEELLSTQPASVIYTSDILRLIFQQRNADQTDVLNREKLSTRRIIALRSLTLSNWLDNHSITKGAKDCLQLVDSKRHIPRLSPAKCQITVIRNEVKINYDVSRAIEHFKKLKEEYLEVLLPGSEDIPIPTGTASSVSEYYPLQNELPVVFGVGKYGLTSKVSSLRKAQAKQLKGYLFFFEQLLAGQLSQLSRLNALFSADPDLKTTVFHQPLYHLPMVSHLFGFENGSSEWENFQTDEENPYLHLLQSAEPKEQFLERRNHLLDHLIARMGEDMQEYAEMVIQDAMKVVGSEDLDFQVVIDLQKEQYRNALERLIRDKSAFYYDLPLLNRDRFQSYGNLVWRLDVSIDFQETPLGYNWRILDEVGSPLLEGLIFSISRLEAERTAGFVLNLALSESSYEVSNGADLNNLIIRQFPGSDALARSFQSFSSQALAEAGRDLIIQSFSQRWVAFTLIPLEHRLYHFLGIRQKQRRSLITPYSEYFEILDETDADPLVEKRFRLWELAGASGEVLLESVNQYEGSDDAAATENALLAVDALVEAGIKSENYSMEEIAPDQFRIALGNGTDNFFVRSVAVFADAAAGQEEISKILEHLYRYYSNEGFYLIEHFLLAPSNTADPGLVIPESPVEPYSFQITFIFPSGLSRDFSDPASIPTSAQPARFREEEFRRYAEKTIRKFCPAHILARIKWVDTARRGTTIPTDAPCFDLFEERYRAWLEAYFRDDANGAEMEVLRGELTACLNTIYQDSLM